MSSFRRRSAPLALAVAPLLVLTACGGSTDEAAPASEPITGIEEEAAEAPEPAEGDQARGPEDAIGRDLMLESVRVQDVNLDDDREEFVEYCFRASIQELTDESGFVLAGLKPSSRVSAIETQLIEDDDRCVLASFRAGTDVDAYTIGIVGNSVVKDRSGEVNIMDSVPLAGGGDVRGVGNTVAPELVRVSVDETLDQARYVFDEDELSDQGANAQAFGYYTANGSRVMAEQIESVEDGFVIVSFGDQGGDQVDEAERFFVEPNAVVDRQGVPNNLGAAGGATAVPDLVSVKRADGAGSQYDFRFDEPVQREDASKFALYTSDGERLIASSVTRPSPEIVRATFSQAMDFPEKIARAAVASDAVVSLNSSTPSNTIGAASLPRAGQDGPTSGPDLLEVTLKPSTGQATFVFDATLEEDSAEPSDFFLITESGSVSTARDIVNIGGSGDSVTGNEVVVLFDEPDAMAAVFGSVNGEAVADQSGEQNPAVTVDVS